MYKVPISVLKECLDNLEEYKTSLDTKIVFLDILKNSEINKKRGIILRKKLKKVKSNIKLLKENYYV